MVLPGFRIHDGLRFVLLGALLVLASGGLQTVPARTSIDPLTETLAPVGHLGGAATVIRLLPDDYAALALGDDLLFLDIIDPYHPVQIGKLSFSSMVVDLHILDNYAYVLAAGRVHIIDFSDLSRPVEITLLGILDVQDIDLDDQYLYIAADVFYIYGISNPAAPEWISTYQSVTYGGYEGGYYVNPGLRVVAAYPYLYLQSQTVYCPLWCYPASAYPEIVDITQPANPVVVSGPGITTVSTQALVDTHDYVFISGAYYTGSTGGKGILVVARANLATLTPSAIIPVWGADLAIQGSTLYVADGEGGIRIFDITNPLSPVEQGWEPSILDPRSVAVKDHLAFVAGGSQGLGVINVRNPVEPILSGGFRTVGDANHITIAGNFLYASSDRLDILDISNPTRPAAVGTYKRRGFPVIAGDVLYLAAGTEGLAAVDISNPAAPVELDLLNLPGEANAVAVDGDFAYVANSDGKLQKINVSDPSALSLENSVFAQSATEIVVSEGYAALAGRSEVSFYDLTQPTPEQVFSYSILVDDGTECSGSGTVKGLAAEGDRVYVLWDFYNVVGKVCILERAGMLLFEKDALNIWQLSAETWWLTPIPLDVEILNGLGYVISGQGDYSSSLSDQLREITLLVFDAENPPYTDLIASRKLSEWVPTGSDLIADLALQDNLVVMGKYEEGIHLLEWLPVQKNYLPAVHNSP
jgi:hypothetical protein